MILIFLWQNVNLFVYNVQIIKISEMAQGMDLDGINKIACFKVLTFCVNDTLSK